MTLLDEVISSVRRMQSEQEEVWQTIQEDNSIGDDGIAELLINVENTLMMVNDKLTSRQNNVSTRT